MTTPIDNDGEQSRAGNLLDEGDLPGALRALDSSLEGISYRLDRKYTRNLVVIIVFALLAVVAIGVAVSSAASSRSAHRDLAAYKAATVEARIGSCKQYNMQQATQTATEIAQSHDFVDALARGIPDPVQRAKDVKAYNVPHDRLVRKGHPARDCTPSGIAAYLSNTTTTKGTP